MDQRRLKTSKTENSSNSSLKKGGGENQMPAKKILIRWHFYFSIINLSNVNPSIYLPLLLKLILLKSHDGRHETLVNRESCLAGI